MAGRSEDYEKMRKECEKLRTEIKNLRADPQWERPNALKQAANRLESAQTSFKARRTLKGHYGKIYALQWATDGTHLVSASQDGKLMIWNAQTTNKRLAIPLRSSWVMTCAYAPSRTFVACGGLDNLCSVYRLSQEKTGWDNSQAFRELATHEGYLSCCRFIDDSEIITSSGDSTCILWDIETKTPKTAFSDHTGDVMSVSIWTNSNIFASGSCDATARVWDYRSGKNCVGNYVGHESDINTVQCFPSGYAFGTGSDDSKMRLFDTRAYRAMNSYFSENILCGITSIDFSKSGKYLFAGYDDEPYAVVWDTLKSERCQTLAGNVNRVSCLGVNSTGTALCTGSWDFFLKIWA